MLLGKQIACPLCSTLQALPLQKARRSAAQLSRLVLTVFEASDRAVKCNATAANYATVGSSQELPNLRQSGSKPVDLGQYKEKKGPVVGAFRNLPQIAAADEHVSSAIRRALKQPTNTKLKNEAHRTRNKATKQVDALTKELALKLRAYVEGFPPISRLHPFEQALLELSLPPNTYERVVGGVNTLRKSILEVGKAYASRVAKSTGKRDALALQAEAFAALQALYMKHSGLIEELQGVAKSLRQLPEVNPSMPTLTLVGAPNVGKSSLVQQLSSGTPDICHYPFTTRSIKMGHFFVNTLRHQVTDTPGLLNRPEKERNAMERLTLATLEHLPTTVMFVADLTGECGTSVSDQWAIRNTLRSKFPGKPWLDVLSKRDLLDEVHAGAATLAESHSVADAAADSMQPESTPADALVADEAAGPIRNSSSPAVQSPESGTEDLQSGGQTAEVPPLEGGTSSGSGRTWAWVETGSGQGAAAGNGSELLPEQFAARLPEALWISTKTSEGIDLLKAAVVAVLRSAAEEDDEQLGEGFIEEQDQLDRSDS